MTTQELHLNEHEWLWITRETPEELAVGPKQARPAVKLALRAVGLADR
jgi:hypothetical protein